MQTSAYLSQVHIAVPKRLKPTVLLLAASFYLPVFSYAMDDAQFEQQHQQLLQDAYWAQLAEHQLKEKLLDQSDHLAAQTAIQQKACAATVLELKYYDFVILNLSDFNRYRNHQGFHKIVSIEQLQQDRLNVQHKYETLKQSLNNRNAICE
ncbi:hypothetical protein M5F03_13445 [Acinetobacter sp. ANC 5579]|uniref:hypothetical protein n=1 Tax=Acinetobacter TaxID=469 RepID=UPI000993498D|nr:MULTISPECIES: hypothetical protein [Acinetobacter]MCL6231424.1 hypothetical protein [Acinetobacter amyesii]MCL6236144.1 hypothetical protein [Acinetobacter amyesii]MCL6243975.1 hypothetical protein [Acinetobacter amyesii]OOV80634.1 hypothetical protein B1201_12920 [Acinetobacter sp. ANC 5600]